MLQGRIDHMAGTGFEQLEADGRRLKDIHLRELFARDPGRFTRFCVTLDDLTIDFSKEKIDDTALASLIALARAAGVEARRDAMAAGQPINETEGRAVLHMALRGQPEDGFAIEGKPIGHLVEDVLARVCAFADAVRGGEYAGAAGRPFTDVVNIGIGGSDLGPAMVSRALTPFRGGGPNVHFVSNVDGAHISETLAPLDPATTLVIVASKTFTTQETMANATSARHWLVQALGEGGAGRHLAALSTNLEATAAFGIDDERVFGFWDWVGGRYSVWSAIGLSVAIAVGGRNFRDFLAGARAMDRHFLEAPLTENLPVLLGLIGIWRRNVMGCGSVALIPYDQRLERFAAYVQQLDMESNGKSVALDGTAVRSATGPVIWGEPGTNAQHSFFQLLHQGTDVIPVDFILAARPREQLGEHHLLLIANCLAQAEALAFGKTEEEVRAEMQAKGIARAEIDRLAPHRTFRGDRPSTIILHNALTPFALGRLIALYEHKVFVQGIIWGINSFDQWGVELGKQLAGELVPILKGERSADGKDASTAGLVARLKELGAG
jgi:glucose-6-phosphate isomerase